MGVGLLLIVAQASAISETKAIYIKLYLNTPPLSPFCGTFMD
jgi:hypothetical protein